MSVSAMSSRVSIAHTTAGTKSQLRRVMVA